MSRHIVFGLKLSFLQSVFVQLFYFARRSCFEWFLRKSWKNLPILKFFGKFYKNIHSGAKFLKTGISGNPPPPYLQTEIGTENEHFLDFRFLHSQVVHNSTISIIILVLNINFEGMYVFCLVFLLVRQNASLKTLQSLHSKMLQN